MRIRNRVRSLWFAWLCLALLPALCVSCGRAQSPAPESGLAETAAAQATAIILRAQAAALVLQAEAKATALVEAAQAHAPPVTLEPVPTPAVASVPERGPDAQAATPVPAQTPRPIATQAATDMVHLIGVSLGQESGLILVQYKVAPALARKWQQGDVYVLDEATGNIYNEIPVVPVIGPLFGRPKDVNQTGYVMLSNAPVPLQDGARVTVVLGQFKQEHVIVK
jgi:hypothetical protein